MVGTATGAGFAGRFRKKITANPVNPVSNRTMTTLGLTLKNLGYPSNE
jgi:hypothetical protein